MAGGEKAVIIGNHGERMMKEFLKLVGWENLSQNVYFSCTEGKKHQRKTANSEKTEHNIDGTFYYNSPLNHEDTDIVLCSSKHNQDTYSNPSLAYNHLKDLAHSLECAPKDFDFKNSFERQGKRKVFKGLLFWVSSNRDEQHESMIDKISVGLIKDEQSEFAEATVGKLRGLLYDSIYLVDNKKASFIYSSITTAQNRFPNTKVQFLFPHTGLNNRSEDLKSYGEVMPIQYINTSLLPIVMLKDGRASVLIFCDSDFDKEYLKRIIWLAHKITGLPSEVDIYFNDYDATRDSQAETRIKQFFQESPLRDRISVRRINHAEFTTLKENPTTNDYALTTRQVEIAELEELRTIAEKSKYLPMEGELDMIIPFGEMIKPIIASSILSETDIKSFLIRKGIYVGNKEKQATVPLLATLLLSPEELNALKYLLKAKEDRVKSVPRRTELNNTSVSIAQIGSIVDDILNNSIKNIALPANCIMQREPIISYQGEGNTEARMDFTLEKQNTTKDLITGKQHNDGAIVFKIVDGSIDSQINYTSRESYDYANKIFKTIERELLQKKLITEAFSSILFNSFDNQSRINFFLSFLNMRSESIFDDAKLEHMVVKPDNSLSEELPFDLESLKDKVNELAISGKELDSVHYFQDEYKQALLMQRVKIKYAFTLGASQGRCIVDLNFKNALTSINAESELSINLEIVKSKSNKGSNLERLTQDLSSQFNKIVQKRLKGLLSEQNIATAPL